MATRPSERKPNRRHYKVEQLPAELVSQVKELLAAGHTYGEIQRHLSALGHPISHSAVARFGQTFLQRYQVMEQTAEMAALLVVKAGNTDLEEAASRLSLDLLVRKLLTMEELHEDVDIVDAIAALAKIQTAAVTREKWKTDVARRVKDAAAAVTAKTLSEGLSLEVVNEIRARILGIAETEGARA